LWSTIRKSPTISLKLGGKEGKLYARNGGTRGCPSSTLVYDSDSSLHSLSACGENE
jgi:hypothetical protein